MWLENFIPSLSLSLNCLGAFLPKPFYSPWASSFQAWGLGKGSNRGFSVGAREDPKYPEWTTPVPPWTYHLLLPLRARVWLRRPPLAFPGPVLAFTQPSPISASLHKPQTHSTSRLLAPGGSSRNFFLFNARQATCCFRYRARHNDRILPSQENSGNQDQMGQWENEPERVLEVNPKADLTSPPPSRLYTARWWPHRSSLRWISFC